MEKRIITEAALSTTAVHPNVVATFHYDIKQVKQREMPEAAISTPLASQDPLGSIQSKPTIEDAFGADWKLFLVQVGIVFGCMNLM